MLPLKPGPVSLVGGLFIEYTPRPTIHPGVFDIPPGYILFGRFKDSHALARLSSWVQGLPRLVMAP